MTDTMPDATPPPPHAVKCLKAEGGRSVWLIQRPGEGPRTLKIWPATPQMLLKFAFGVAQPQRQSRGARRLIRAGIATPCVVRGPCVRFRHGRVSVELELDYAEGVSLHAVLHKPEHAPASIQVATAVAAAVGDLLAMLTARRIFHRDFKPSNIIVETDSPHADPRLWLIDPAGVRSMHWSERDLARMLRSLAQSINDTRLPGQDARRWRMIVLRRAVKSLDRSERPMLTQLLRQATVRPSRP